MGVEENSCEAASVVQRLRERNRAWRAAPLALLLFHTACNGAAPAAPGLVLRDATTSPDGASSDGGAIRPDASRPATPRLPPADLELVLPYFGEATLVELEAAANLRQLDVHFSIDTTGSFGDEIDALQADLEDRIVPGLTTEVPDVAFAVSRFEDFPEPPFGASSDRPFRLLTPITTDLARVGAAVAALDQPLGLGGDIPESGLEALYQIATGDGYRVGATSIIPRFRATETGSLGGSGFRERALRTVVHVTDAPTHGPTDYGAVFPGTRDLEGVLAAAEALELRVLGVSSGDAARPYLEALALGTGASVTPPLGEGCPTGLDGTARPPVRGVCPLVFDIAEDGTGLSEAVIDALVELVSAVRFREIYGTASDDPFRFVRHIRTVDATPPPGVAPPEPADLRPSDGQPDTFLHVGPGTTCRFEVSLRNLRIPPADYEQTFVLRVSLLGDDLLLTERRIRIVVPRGRLARRDAGIHEGGGRDAGPAEDADNGAPDAGTVDAGTAGAVDAGTVDAGTVDAGTVDAGTVDAGTV